MKLFSIQINLIILFQSCIYIVEYKPIPDCESAICHVERIVTLETLESCYLNTTGWDVPDDVAALCGLEPQGDCLLLTPERPISGPFPCDETCEVDPAAACVYEVKRAAALLLDIQLDQTSMSMVFLPTCLEFSDGRYSIECTIDGMPLTSR